MNDTVIQGVIWVAAGALLMLYLKRRRSRRTTSLEGDKSRPHSMR